MKIVNTKLGKIRGIEENGTIAFKNIPYASPPTGERRFRPPAPPQPWEGVRDGTRYGKVSPQFIDPNFPMKMADAKDLSEDSLYLNVYTPAADDKKRPVYFYIHGGAFQMGSHAFSFKPEMFVKEDIVCVTCNYRLGVLGFFQMDEYLGSEYLQSGNSGLLDIVMALRWTRENIAAMGGDPDNIVLMGQSAGAKIVATLLLMPDARGTFTGAVMQSGSTQCIRDIASAHHVVDIFMEELGLTKETGKEILTMPWEKIVEKQGKVIAGIRNLHSCGPVFDGVTIPGNNALELIRKGDANCVRILCGYTRDEVQMYYDCNGITQLDDKTAKDMFGLYASYAQETVSSQVSPDDDGTQFVDAMSKYLYGYATVQMLDAFTEAGKGNPLYMYRLDWDEMPMRAHHCLDTAFTMGEVGGMQEGIEDTPTFQPLADRIRDAWLSFIKEGVPHAAGLPEWPPYTMDDKRMMRFDTECEVVPALKVDLDPKIPHQVFKL